MISVIITAYNVEAYIEEAIMSVINLTYKDIELVVVEDCSTDNTKQILQRLCENYPIKIIYNEKNVGAGLSRRYGITAASSERFLLLDGDDWLGADFIESLENKYLETGADIVSGGMTIVKEDGSMESSYYGERIIVGGEKLSHHYTQKAVFMANKLINKKLHDLVPYYERRYIEDTPVIAPMLYYANKVAYVNNAGYYYRMRNSSLTHTTNPLKENLYLGLCASDLFEFFKDKGEYYSRMFSINLFRSYLVKLFDRGFTSELLEPYKDDWTKLWLFAANHNSDKEVLASCPTMYIVDRLNKIAFLNTFNPYLNDIKSIVLQNNGYSVINDVSIYLLLPNIPGYNQVLLEDISLWESVNYAVEKVVIDCSPLINVAYVWTNYIIGNKKHPVFDEWKKVIKNEDDFIKLLKLELEKPIIEQVEELRNNLKIIKNSENCIKIDEIPSFLENKGFNTDKFFAPLDLTLPDLIILAAKKYYDI